MRTAKELRAEIKKAEAKGKTCTFDSTRRQWAEKVAFLRREFELQEAWEAAGKPRPKALPRPRTPRPAVLIPEVMPPPPRVIDAPRYQLSTQDFTVGMVLITLMAMFGFSHWLVIAGLSYYYRRSNV
jgi:hypothetical protein